MAHKLKSYCHIYQYLDKAHPKVFEIADDLCAMRQLRGRPDAGVTLIIPSTETMKKLDKLVGEVETDKAMDIFLSHIIRDYLPDARAWETKKADIPNMMNKHLEIEGIKGDEVKLKDGTVIVPDTAFILRGPDGKRQRNPNQAVWKVKSGSIDPAKFTKEATGRLARAPANGEHKRAEGGAPSDQRKLVSVLVKALIDNSKAIHSGGKATNGGGNPFGFLAAVWDAAKNDDTAHKYLSLVLSPLPITSLAFVLREGTDDKPNPVSDIAAQVWAQRDSWHHRGIESYKKAVGEAHSKIGGRRGGGYAFEGYAALGKAIEESLNKHKKALEDKVMTDVISEQLFTRLNMARYFEYDLFKKLHKQHVEISEIDHAIKETVGLILDNANASNTLTTDQTSTAPIAVFIRDLLTQIQDFTKSPWCEYPIGKTHPTDTVDVVSKLFVDEGWDTKLAMLGKEQLAELFRSVNVAQSDASPPEDTTTTDAAE